MRCRCSHLLALCAAAVVARGMHTRNTQHMTYHSRRLIKQNKQRSICNAAGVITTKGKLNYRRSIYCCCSSISRIRTAFFSSSGTCEVLKAQENNSNNNNNENNNNVVVHRPSSRFACVRSFISLPPFGSAGRSRRTSSLKSPSGSR